MKTVAGYWFAPKDKKLANGDGRKIRVGITHKVKGEIIPCVHGLHLSKRVFDALIYAPGPIIYKVKGYGIIVPHGNPVDKYACSERTYMSGGYDCTELLRLFARKCALDVIHLWDAPKIVKQYLKTGDESLRAAARAAANAAAWADARAAAWAAAGAAARADARDAARDAAYAAADAARAAAWDAAGAAARAAAWDAARAAAGAAYITKANKRLIAMLSKYLQTPNNTFTKNDKGFNEFKFAALALNKKSNRAYKRVLKVDQGTVTGTDGYRLHTCKGISCETDGYFEVIQNNKTMITLKQVTEEVYYPDIEQLFEYDTKGHFIKTNDIKTKDPNNYAMLLYRINNNSIIINPAYVKDIMSFDSFAVSISAHNEPVVFINGTKRAYVMPVKNDDI